MKLNIHRSCASAFRCLEAGGAVLALPEGATVCEAMNKLHFQRHAARHAISWYEYMLNKGRDVTNVHRIPLFCHGLYQVRELGDCNLLRKSGSQRLLASHF